MKVEVNKDICIGCGLCEDMVGDIFSMGDDIVALVNDDVDDIYDDYADDIQEAASLCPTGAINIEE